MGLPSFSIHRPVLTIMIFVIGILLGVISLTRLPVELYQGGNQGIISIIVRARGGLPPPEVEKSITKPVEEAVATVSHLKNLYSSSREAESRVTLEFDTGTNMNFAALEIREKFSRVKPLLPKEIEKPVIANYDDAQSAVFIFALTSNTLSPEDIRQKVELELKPVVARVDGVASVEVYGGRERKILVEVDRDKLAIYNISIEKIMDILGQANVNLLSGTVDKGKYEFAVRSMGAFENVEEIGELGVQATRQGSIVPLKELATVKDAYMEPEDAARLNLEQNVTVYVKKTSLANTIPVVHNCIRVLDEFKQKNKETLDVVIVSDKAKTIVRAIHDVRDSMFLGIVLTIIMIYVALRQIVLAIIISVAIPCSVIITFAVMGALGFSLNVMTLSGLALAIGIMVDSAVVVMENTFVKKEKGMGDGQAIREAAEEVWLPLLSSLITTCIVFVPITFIDKKIQETYSGFALTVTSSLIISFFVALMLIPVMLMQWGRGRIKVEKREPGQERSGLQRTYAGIMKFNLMFRYPVAAATIALFCLASYNIVTRDIDFPTTLEENEFQVIIFPLAGARLEANDEAVTKVEELIHKVPDVDMISSTVRKDDVRVFVRLKPKEERQYSKEEIMQMIDEKGNELVKEIHDDYSLILDEGASSSEQKKLVVNIFGYENDVLEKLAREFANRMSKVDGLVNVVMTDLRKRPEYSLVIDKGRAAIYGLTVKNVADSVHALVRGMRPTKFHELTNGQEIETITRLQAIYRQKIEDLKLIYIASPKDGHQIPLGEIASFYATTGPQTIDRKDKYRYVFVKGDCKTALETVAKQVQEAVKDVPLPDDYYWRFGGSYEELVGGKSDMNVALILTVALVYMVLACTFESYFLPAILMLSVPMASIGIWLALTIGRKPLSQPVFIGMILLAGYVVNASIMMVDAMKALMAQKGMSRREALIEAGCDRIRPIMMTTTSTILGFVPMAISSSESSNLWSPLAVTVIGGLLSSTILTLFIMPNFILISDDFGVLVRGTFGIAMKTIETAKSLVFAKIMRKNT
ncbi:MAG TPA: efflux RND transporter permease subunit [Verrucomicrobiae bacterium]|nr:efflux RND transporter permease subunit [Verrucomicrobiae bacterium]